MAYIDIKTRVYVPDDRARKVTKKLVAALADAAKAAVKADAEKAFGTTTNVASGYEYAYILFAKRIVTRVARVSKNNFLKGVG